MSLTFEMANLDVAPMYRDSFNKHEDLESALLMQRILEDEISHVSFGYQWLKKLKDESQTDWDSWRGNVPERLPLHRAKGFVLQEEHRKKANIPDSWIAEFKKV